MVVKLDPLPVRKFIGSLSQIKIGMQTLELPALVT
jgi:hypothetical protein